MVRAVSGRAACDWRHRPRPGEVRAFANARMPDRREVQAASERFTRHGRRGWLLAVLERPCRYLVLSPGGRFASTDAGEAQKEQQ